MQAIQNARHLKVKRRRRSYILLPLHLHLACGLYFIHSRKYAQLAEIRENIRWDI